jgi:sugar lactone lactonase YvrE
MQVLQRRRTRSGGEGPNDSTSRLNQDLVIREARRRQRRRWLGSGAVLAVLVVVVAAVISVTARSPITLRRVPPSAPTHRVTANPSPAAGIQPIRPGALAVGPNGNVYVADDLRDQVLERLANGTFRVIAGSGTVGFSGDNGPAAKADLDNPAGLIFSPSGTLYVADYGNGRIRAVSPSGMITTVAGDGQGSWVADGTPALGAQLLPSAIAFGPHGLMYVASDNEILRLGADGSFYRVVGNPNSSEEGLFGVGGPAVNASADAPDGLAFDSEGNLYIAGFQTKTILMVNAQGTLSVIGSAYPRGDGGLVTEPDGTVLAMDELDVLRLTPQGEQTIVSFPTTDRTTYLGITGFSPDGIAVAPDGDIYLDTFYGNGYADKSALVVISPGGNASLLWARNPAKDES